MTVESDNTYMMLALEEAHLAQMRDEVPIGAIVVDSTTGDVIARAGNRTIELSDPTAHAEVLAIREACQKAKSQRIPTYDLYVTLEPCTMCAGAISFARIRKLVFAASDKKGGAVESGTRFFEQPSCHHKIKIVSGIEAEKSSALLKSYFKAKRTK